LRLDDLRETGDRIERCPQFMDELADRIALGFGLCKCRVETQRLVDAGGLPAIAFEPARSGVKARRRGKAPLAEQAGMIEHHDPRITNLTATPKRGRRCGVWAGKIARYRLAQLDPNHWPWRGTIDPVDRSVASGRKGESVNRLDGKQRFGQFGRRGDREVSA